jgi:hypothetical protein
MEDGNFDFVFIVINRLILYVALNSVCFANALHLNPIFFHFHDQSKWQSNISRAYIPNLVALPQR